MHLLLVASAAVNYLTCVWVITRFFTADERLSNAMKRLRWTGALCLILHGVGILLASTASMVLCWLSTILYLVSTGIIIWAVLTIGKLRPRLAFSETIPTELCQTGPYSLVRHPFYFSYSMMWIAGAIVSPWYLGLTPLLVMLPQYWSAIRFEEQQMLLGPLRAEYEGYQKRVGWFFPKTLRMMDWSS